LEAPRYPGRDDERSLSEILPHIRFAMMTADQLCELERSPIVERFSPLLAAHIHRAYKYHSLSLTARAAMREFAGPTFLLRNYTETRWDKRLVIHNYSTYSRCSEVCTPPPAAAKYCDVYVCLSVCPLVYLSTSISADADKPRDAASRPIDHIVLHT